MAVNKIGENLGAFSIRSINHFIVISAFLDFFFILRVENLKLRILSLRVSQTINEDRLKKTCNSKFEW